MECQDTQMSIVESFAEPLGAATQRALDEHLMGCETCRRFSDTQTALDARLAAAFPPEHLSAVFRGTLKRRVRRHPSFAWPDFLPDIAHLIGCAVAVGASALILPQHREGVILVGAAFTCLTYFLQAAIRSCLSGAE